MYHDWLASFQISVVSLPYVSLPYDHDQERVASVQTAFLGPRLAFFTGDGDRDLERHFLGSKMRPYDATT